MLLEKKPSNELPRTQELPTSRFKLEILHSMMSEANLFEEIEDVTAQEALEKLNHLLKVYANCRIAKLRATSNSTVEFRIVPLDGETTFTFDALSSGQKEIISTLFLLWRYSNPHQGIILIDEPELHLNLELHRGFIKQLYKLAPQSQYLITTHSEGIFSSVDQEMRVLLTKESLSSD
jgi:predicted ATP-dependent endonuclease of OLD family